MKVLTNEGEKNIEDVRVGDKVLSKDETTGELAYKEVSATFNHETGTDEIYRIHVGDQVIESTFNHPFWVDGRGWTFVEDLKVGDLLVQSNGNKLKIESIKLEHESAKVYNMTVDEFHTYFVSELGIWVHNTSCIPWSSKSVGNAANQLSKGAKDVTVGSRSEAEELFLRLYQGKGFKNTTGMSAKEAKDFFGKKSTYHWDDEVGADGRVTGHGPGNAHGDMPHLQIHDENGKVIRIFFK
ncbi:polymorphic toxin-type HINT domain-containing protein [Cohnella sp. GCM10012308]|uniref:polymorphic toxin-type HINT domain-containing protein n=1 Tax=Cohnella sp. GCM10012308 TaxID=3317329 RepID=UPI0036072220